LTVERRDFELALDQAKADVASAQSQVLLAQAEGDAARQNYALLNPGQPVPPLVAKLPQIAQGRAQLQAAQARRDIAELDLSRTQFTLPFAGRVTETSAEIGQMVSRGQSFGQAFSVESVEVTVPVSQIDLSRLQPVEGRSVTVSSDEKTFVAVVERVSAELDGRTRFAKLFLSLQNEISITPGAFVDVVVQGPTVEKTFVLPESAEQGGGYIWWVNEGTLAQHNPKILARTGSNLIVEAFNAGQGIVVGPVPGAFEGLKVKMAVDS
jgi:RND family efflux transporter MFP subunit